MVHARTIGIITYRRYAGRSFRGACGSFRVCIGAYILRFFLGPSRGEWDRGVDPRMDGGIMATEEAPEPRYRKGFSLRPNIF
jgi:hypothetical protein